MPLGLGWSEVLIILTIALVLFGSKLPRLAYSLGKSLTEFKKGVNEIQGDLAPIIR